MNKTIKGVSELICLGVALALTVAFTLSLCLTAWMKFGEWGWVWYAKAPAMLLVAPCAYAVGNILGTFAIMPLTFLFGLVAMAFSESPRAPK